MDTRKRFVAMLDIMGSSNTMKTNPDAMGDILIECKKLIQRYRSHSNLYITMFSDSITVVTKDDEDSSFEDIVYAAAILERMFIQKTFAINGAISYGNITIDEGEDFVFYGEPVIDAHKIQEDLFFYGIVLDSNAINKMKSYAHCLFCVNLSGAFSHPDMIIEMMCPCKSKGWHIMNAINWMDFCVLREDCGGFVTYGEQIPTVKRYMTQLYEKYTNNITFGGRANIYLINTELVLRQWYDFTGERNQTDKWGLPLADSLLIKIPN